jgi:CheY-like chemotaxis protein
MAIILPFKSALSSTPPPPMPRKVLLVEDHPGLAKVSCDLLRRYGHEVHHALNGEAALAAAAAISPDIVLLDLALPDMHGYKLAESLRRLPGGDRPILVALTGFGLTGDEAQSLAAGIDAHFRKPMDFGELTRLQRRAGRPPAADEARTMASSDEG